METIKPRVLVIDDDPANADTLVMVLNISGFEATAAYSGEHGLALAQDSPFDLLVTDVMMNDMNGIDAAIAIRTLQPRCRIVLISGTNNAAALLADAAAKGYTFDILAKPVHPTFLLQQMRSRSQVEQVPNKEPKITTN